MNPFTTIIASCTAYAGAELEAAKPIQLPPFDGREHDVPEYVSDTLESASSTDFTTSRDRVTIPHFERIAVLGPTAPSTTSALSNPTIGIEPVR